MSSILADRVTVVQNLGFWFQCARLKYVTDRAGSWNNPLVPVHRLIGLFGHASLEEVVLVAGRMNAKPASACASLEYQDWTNHLTR